MAMPTTDGPATTRASNDGPTNDGPDPSRLEAEIRKTAYELYCLRGGTPGDDVADWLEAERLVRARHRSSGTAETVNEARA